MWQFCLVQRDNVSGFLFLLLQWPVKFDCLWLLLELRPLLGGAIEVSARVGYFSCSETNDSITLGRNFVVCLPVVIFGWNVFVLRVILLTFWWLNVLGGGF